jgi:hypothetical protein
MSTGSSTLSRIGSALGLASAVVILVLTFRDHFLHGKRGEQVHQDALQEFALIKPVQDASRLSSHDNFSSWEPRKVLVGATYSTSLPYSEIRAHYNTEMKSHNWTVVEERHLTDWGRDLGGREVRYCKGELSSSLEYAGTKAQYGWTYAVDVSWAIDGCKGFSLNLVLPSEGWSNSAIADEECLGPSVFTKRSC